MWRKNSFIWKAQCWSRHCGQDGKIFVWSKSCHCRRKREEKKSFMLIKDAERSGAFLPSAGELSLKKRKRENTSLNVLEPLVLLTVISIWINANHFLSLWQMLGERDILNTLPLCVTLPLPTPAQFASEPSVSTGSRQGLPVPLLLEIKCRRGNDNLHCISEFIRCHWCLGTNVLSAVLEKECCALVVPWLLFVIKYSWGCLG